MKKSTKDKIKKIKKCLATLSDITLEPEELQYILEPKHMKYTEIQELREETFNFTIHQVQYAPVIGTKFSTFKKWEQDVNIKGATKEGLRIMQTINQYPWLPFLFMEPFKKRNNPLRPKKNKDKIFKINKKPKQKICHIIEDGILCETKVRSRGVCNSHQMTLKRLGKFEEYALESQATNAHTKRKK